MECEFNRPSGLCCDDYGNVLIADSKNQRAMVYNAKFEFQYEVSTMIALHEFTPQKFVYALLIYPFNNFAHHSLIIGGFE